MVGGRLTAVHLLARFRGISPLLEANKRKPLRTLCISVLGQKDSRHTTKPLKHVAKVLLLCEFGDLRFRRVSQLPRATHLREGRSLHS